MYVYTTLTNVSTKYLVICKVYTDVDGIKELYHDCQSVRNIIHYLKLVDYLHVQAATHGITITDVMTLCICYENHNLKG